MTYNPPVVEPDGYRAMPGFVKSRPENNDYYVEQFKDDPWYPIIKDTHERIKEIAPGYNVAQIKEKFGGLRYYIDLPEGSIKIGRYSYEDTVEKQTERIKSLISSAEAWVDGFEYAQGRRN